MKKLTLLWCLLTVALFSACDAQREAIVQQEDPDAINAYVWATPVSENLTFKNLLPENVVVILLWDAKSQPKFVMTSKNEVDSLKLFFQTAQQTNAQLPVNRFVGLEVSIAKIDGLSFLAEEQLKTMSTEDQKKLAQALNPYKKYTLMNKNTKPVLGFRKDGKYYPDFESYTYSNPQSSNQPNTNQQNKPQKSDSYFDHPKKQ